MTHKITIKIHVDAPTPEQFERYLNANGWRVAEVQPYLPHWKILFRCDETLGFPNMTDEHDFAVASNKLLAYIAARAGKPELEVYNEIVKVVSNES